jgi:thioredoxin 1
MKISTIILAMSLLVGLSACSEQVVTETKIKADAFEQMLTTNPNVQLVDVRTAVEYHGGHLENAVNIDLFSEDFSNEIDNQLDRTKPVLLYCKKGGRSAKALDQLKEMGFEEVYDLQGGYDSWVAYNKKVITPEKEENGGLTFEKAILGEKLVMVDFTAEWCRPCQMMEPAILKLAEELKENISIVQVDVDVQQDVAGRYGIEAMPTLVFIKNGKEVHRTMGMKSEDELRTLIESQLASKG